MLDKLTVEQFASCVNQTFTLTVGPSRLELVLVSATTLGTAPAPTRHPFSLIFRGPHQPVLAQRIYPLEHAKLGVLNIFLVPIGPDSVGMRYEAVFS